MCQASGARLGAVWREVACALARIADTL